MVEGFDEDLRTALWGRNSPAGMLIRKRTLRPLEGGIGLLKNDDEKGAIGMLKVKLFVMMLMLSVFTAFPALADGTRRLKPRKLLLWKILTMKDL